MENFLDFNIGHVINIVAICLAWFGYKSTRVKDIAEAQAKREKEREDTIRMHTENRERLDNLTDFHKFQIDLNKIRDEQVSLLREQTASFKHMAEGLDRRLQLIENRSLGRVS